MNGLRRKGRSTKGSRFLVRRLSTWAKRRVGSLDHFFLLDPRNHIIQTKWSVPSGVNTILTPTSEHPLAPIWQAESYARVSHALSGPSLDGFEKKV